MKFSKIKILGACALLAIAAGMTSAHAAGNNSPVCETSPTQEFVFGGFENANGTTIEGMCASAINKANQAFDSTIDQNITNKLITTALDTMSKDAATNPEAKKLQEMYRAARVDFTNGFIKEYKFEHLPTVGDGKRRSDTFGDLAKDYSSKELTEDKIKDLTSKFREQAKKSITYSMR